MAHSDVQTPMGEARLPLNLDSLQSYLKAKVPEVPCDGLLVKQFGTGTSNPTYLLWSPSNEQHRFVLRRRPPGKLLPGAHQIDREYRVMKALHAHGVSVPRMIAYCDDPEIIGQEFYIMECIAGRVIQDAGAVSYDSAEDRAQLWKSIAAAVASLHDVDYKAAGLEGFAKAGGYVARQVKTWGRQFEAADAVVQEHLQRPELSTTMRRLQEYLLANADIMEPEATCVVHGDINTHNMLMHAAEPRVVAILDWEISTLGHPLVDLDYATSGLSGGWMPKGPPYSMLSDNVEGVPTRREFIEEYFQQRNLPVASDSALGFAHLVNMFRYCAIIHGVLARGLSGNAASGTSRNEVVSFRYTAIVDNIAQILQKQGVGPVSKL